MARGKPPNGSRGSRKRRGKSEDFTGEKETEVVVNDGSQLDLQPVEFRKDDFHAKLRSLRDIRKQMNQLKSAHSHVMKGAKDVNEEFPTALKLALNMDTKSERQIARELLIHGFVLKELNSNLQISLHD